MKPRSPINQSYGTLTGAEIIKENIVFFLKILSVAKSVLPDSEDSSLEED